MQKNSVGKASKIKTAKKAVSAVKANSREAKKAAKLEKKQAKKDLKIMKKVYTKAIRKESPERIVTIFAILLSILSVVLDYFITNSKEQ